MDQYNAKEKFDIFVWKVLDKIQEELVPYKGIGHKIDYSITYLVKNQHKKYLYIELKAIEYLLNEKVMEEIEEAWPTQVGDVVYPPYVGLIRHFKILDKFAVVYDKYEKIYKQIVGLSRDNKSNFSISPRRYKDPNISDWKVKHGQNSGVYIISSEMEIPFRGGFFGGINLLIENSGHDVPEVKLREAISKTLQGKNKMPGEINLYDWKSYLMKEKKNFATYFDIVKRQSAFRLYLIQ